MKSSIADRISVKVSLIDGPLVKYAGQFISFLESQYYSQGRIYQYVLFIVALDRFMGETGVDVKDLDENRAINFVAESNQSSAWKKQVYILVRVFVKFLVDMGVTRPVSPPLLEDTAYTRLRRDYVDYLRHQRGLSERTIYHCWRFTVRFLKFRFPDGEWEYLQITPLDIVRFVQHLISRKKPLRDKTIPTHLRNFFLFLFKSGRTITNLAPGIPRVAQRSGVTLPRHITPEQVETLIAAVRTDTPIGRRNHAMMLLLARLGLRAPEVIAIQVEDIDWRAGEILVRGKGQRHDRMPLPRDVGEALADYIRRDRATTSRTLFVTNKAPHKPFHDSQVLNEILLEAFTKTGLKPPTKYLGSHILRHSLAMNLVRKGASLHEVSDMLRHRSRQSTMIYAKLDIDGLRSIAQPWPVKGGTK